MIQKQLEFLIKGVSSIAIQTLKKQDTALQKANYLSIFTL